MDNHTDKTMADEQPYLYEIVELQISSKTGIKKLDQKSSVTYHQKSLTIVNGGR